MAQWSIIGDALSGTRSVHFAGSRSGGTQNYLSKVCAYSTRPVDVTPRTWQPSDANSSVDSVSRGLSSPLAESEAVTHAYIRLQQAG